MVAVPALCGVAAVFVFDRYTGDLRY